MYLSGKLEDLHIYCWSTTPQHVSVLKKSKKHTLHTLNVSGVAHELGTHKLLNLNSDYVCQRIK